MGMFQLTEHKDLLLIVDDDQVGPKQRLNRIAPAPHPMVREDWGTVDRLRGVLGEYYTVYYSSRGLALLNYGAAVYPGAENIHAWDHHPSNLKRLRKQLQKPVLKYIYAESNPSSGNPERLLITRETDNWNDYSNKSSAATNWLSNHTHFYNFISGTYSFGDEVFDGILNDILGVSLSDHTAEFFLPSSNADMRLESGMNLYVEPVYNYYDASVPVYETTIADLHIKEYHLPNVYFLQSELNNTSSTLLATYHLPALTLDQTIEWFTVSNAQTATETNVGEYYQLYSNKLSKLIFNTPEYNEIDLSLQHNNRNFVVLHSDLGALKEDDIQTLTMPFYTKLIMGYDADSRSGWKKDVSLLKRLAVYPDTKDFIDMLQFQTVLKLTQPTDTATNISFQKTFWKKDANIPAPPFDTDVVEYPVLYDLEEMLDEMLLGSNANVLAATINNFTSFDPAVQAILGLDLETVPFRLLRDYKRDEEEMVIDPQHAQNASLDLFEDPGGPVDIGQVVKTFQQVLDGAKCHTETLMYVVKKRPVIGGVVQPPIQTYYISEQFPQVFPITLFDSQVKYNQKYIYDIDRVVLVFGNEYEYVASHRFMGTTSVPVLNNVSIKAIVIPYIVGGINTIIIDKPPVPPEISFYAHQGIDNQVHILLNSSTGELNAKPVAILDIDKAFFEEEYLAQYGMPLSFEEIMNSTDAKKIQFRSDDPVDLYELFRLDDAPEAYADFAAGRVLSIDPDYGIPGERIDRIEPNRKYYYCARSIDVHENKSNPTHIYEIEMINNNGQIFLKQEIFSFKSIRETYVKSGRRFLYLEPSLRQVIYDPETANPGPTGLDIAPPTNTLLGAPQIDRVWGKKFKVRVTSKKTGRKIDLNITFKNSGIVKPSE